jgi:hypothetical protein
MLTASTILQDYDPNKDDLNIVFVASVYYTTNISYSYSNDSASALSGAVTPLAGIAPASTAKSATSSASEGPTVNVTVNGGSNEATTNGGGAAASTPPTASSTAAANLQALITALNQQSSGTNLGGTITIASADEQGTALSQTFPYPVAIGYRAFKCTLQPADVDPDPNRLEEKGPPWHYPLCRPFT